LITHVEDPDENGDDLLVALLRPGTEPLAPPPGAFEAIRRGAARRRRLRAAVGGAVTLAVAAAVSVPLYLATVVTHPAPAGPLAPPAVGTPRPTAPTPAKSVGPRVPTPPPTRPATAMPTPSPTASTMPPPSGGGVAGGTGVGPP
jgi:hypothetical protein